jgi:hypothetical protein
MNEALPHAAADTCRPVSRQGVKQRPAHAGEWYARERVLLEYHRIRTEGSCAYQEAADSDAGAWDLFPRRAPVSVRAEPMGCAGSILVLKEGPRGAFCGCPHKSLRNPCSCPYGLFRIRHDCGRTPHGAATACLWELPTTLGLLPFPGATPGLHFARCALAKRYADRVLSHVSFESLMQGG